MIFVDIILFAVIALFITFIFSWGAGSRGPWGTFWTAFLITFLFIWIADAWIAPVGPIYYGIAWVPLFFVGITIAFLLLAATPSYYRKRRTGKVTSKTSEANETGLIALDIFFWLVIGILLIAIILSYV